MRRKILFTGNGKAVIDDLMVHIPSIYQSFKCPSSEREFICSLERSKPDLVVIALSKETRMMLRMYSDLRDRIEYYHLPLIAIGSEEDCIVFRNNVFQKNMECFIRPINMEAFVKTMDKLSAISVEMNKEKDEKMEKSSNSFKQEKRSRPSLTKVEKDLNYQQRKSILVVDDDVKMLNVIKMYLEDLYDVTVVPNGKLALKFLSKKHTDLVLLDYMMPEEDGPSVLKQIRENSPYPHIPVMFLTGVSEKEKVLKGLEFHPNGYILKPVKREVLLDRVTEILLDLL